MDIFKANKHKVALVWVLRAACRPITMRGFLMYHKLRPRHVFIDELYVRPAYRGQGVAKSLVNVVAKGPVELIVDRANAKAIALYVAVGFCSQERSHYLPGAHELCMRTTSFIRTKAKTAAAAALHTVEGASWNEISHSTQMSMIRALQREWTVSMAAARRRLRVDDDAIRFLIA